MQYYKTFPPTPDPKASHAHRQRQASSATSSTRSWNNWKEIKLRYNTQQRHDYNVLQNQGNDTLTLI
jgi:hypothetical protein